VQNAADAAGVVKCEQFVEQPQDAVVSRGQSHVLTCIVKDRVGEVQWLRDGFGFGPGDELEGFPRYRIQRNDLTGNAGRFTHFRPYRGPIKRGFHRPENARQQWDIFRFVWISLWRVVTFQSSRGVCSRTFGDLRNLKFTA